MLLVRIWEVVEMKENTNDHVMYTKQLRVQRGCTMSFETFLRKKFSKTFFNEVGFDDIMNYCNQR